MENIDNRMKFINVIDRYLEVSYVYSQRIKKSKDEAVNKDNKVDNSTDRLLKLIELLEKAKFSEGDEELQIGDADKRQGQNIKSSEGLFEQTRWYQEVIKQRLENNSYNALNAHNERQLRKLINMEPKKCLAAFQTPSYAWDILTEFASLSFLPSSDKLAATDMIHMHLIELRQHLFKVMAQAKMISPESLLELKGRYTVGQLNEWNRKNNLVEVLITESMHMEVSQLLDEVHSYTAKYDTMFKIIAENESEIITRLEQEVRGYPDILEEDIDMKAAENLCDKIVLYGLGVGYITWLSFAEKDETFYQILFKHCLFCTKTLLAEKRWRVCQGIAELGLEIIRRHNEKEKDESKQIYPFMITANWFLARKMLSDKSVIEEIREWELSEKHKRYMFIQKVLLDKNDDAFELAKKLLVKEADGRPDMSLSEFEEWPILDSFRKSEYWEVFLRFAEENAY